MLFQYYKNPQRNPFLYEYKNYFPIYIQNKKVSAFKSERYVLLYND